MPLSLSRTRLASLLSGAAALAAVALVAPGARAETPADKALTLAQTGARAMADGDVAQACRLFEAAVALTPTWATAHFELARCLRLAGQPQRSLRHLEEAEKRLDGQAVLFIERARLAEDAGDLATAYRHFTTALKRTPADIRAIFGAARLAPEREGAQAMARLHKLLVRQPFDVALLRRLAEVAEAAGRLDDAEAALRKALEHSRNKPFTAALLGRFGQRHGRPAAVEAARRALAIH